MDISDLSLAELEELQKRIPAEIQNRHAAGKQALIKELTAIAAAKGFKVSELFSDQAAPPAKARPRKPVAAKYRHPQDPTLAWTGRGKKPKWVTAWLAEGKSLEKLKI